MAVSQTSSRLQLLQARFQQKQLQEKEQKLLQLYDQQQQRAHQVAQRGSAGSNGSNHSVNASAAKVKQLFADERRQQNGVKGIDKSYPLDPLKSKKTSPINRTTKPTTTLSSVNNKNNNNNNNSSSSNNNNMTNRKSNSNVRRVIKADVNSNVSSTSRSISSRENLVANAYSRQENFSRESYASRYSSEATNSESIRQVNGHAKNGYHYEINIDDVIDNEALQRNRMLAKFQPGDIERRRRRLSADIDDDEFPPDTQYDVSSRKSSLKNAKSNPTIAVATGKKTIPSRESTVMKSTQSARMKVCNPAQNRNRLVLRRKSSLVAPRKAKKVIVKPNQKTVVEAAAERCCEISERCFPPPWNTLKSTSLICEIIRKHSKLQQMRSKSNMGRVKTIVTKIESQTMTTKPAAGSSANPQFVPAAKSIENRLLQMTRDVEPVASTSQQPLDLLNANFVEALKAAESQEMLSRNVENEDQGDALVAGQVNQPNASDVQPITTAIDDQPIEPDHNLRVLSSEDVNRVRRASFEQKRRMFELLLHRRHNSVESALCRFDDDDDDDKSKAADEQTHSCRKGSISSDSANRTVRGFERSTSAWTIKTSSSSSPKRKNKSHSKKIHEARDSIELARVPVMTNLPACKKRIILHKKSCENDDASPCGSAFQRSRSPQLVAKLDCCLTSSSTKLETSLNKPDDSITKLSEVAVAAVVKHVPPYPSSKSPDNRESKSRSVVKSTSLKLLSRFANSSGDVPTEVDSPLAPRKSSVHSEPPAEHEEKLPTVRAPITPAPRTSSSSSSVGTTRSQGSRSALTTKTKTPTPAARTTAPSNADDSLITCKICTRRFQTERIAKHEQICAKTAQKKRKQFDAMGHRVKGTELESFVQKPNKKQSKALAASNSSNSSKLEPQKSNWRRKHEDFINAIRSAKLMQAHLAAGGKLSDLPPPPPSDNSDYVQCPHCSRKFNAGVAERHIPKCETMQHNKPKPKPKR